MNVLFISLCADDLIMPTLPLGLVSVATAVRGAGHRVKIIELKEHDDTQQALSTSINDFQPDCIGISVRNIDDQTMQQTRFLLPPLREVVRHCRDLSDALIIAGGAGCSLYPESVLEYLGADIGIRGEGEIAVPAVLLRLRQGSGFSGIAGVYTPGRNPAEPIALCTDMNMLPQPDCDLWPCSASSRTVAVVPFQTRRGCSMNCSYCSTAAIEGARYRGRSPKAVLASIVQHVHAGYRRFFCTDNTFNFPAAYAHELCSELIRARLDMTWISILYPCRIDEELVGAMARAGCSEISLGFESGCERMLRAMHKQYTPDDVLWTARLLANYGIRQQGFLLLGGPGETRQSVEESLAFADSLPLDTLKITVGIRIYPHTELVRVARSEGIVSPGGDVLLPAFYLARGLEGWIYEKVHAWMEERPHWQM